MSPLASLPFRGQVTVTGFLENQDLRSGIEDQRSRIEDQGARIQDPGSRIQDLGHTGVHLDGHQHGGRKPTETSVSEFCYQSLN